MPFSLDLLTYNTWPTCYRLSDGRVEVIATADVGPRLIRFGFVGGPNEFVELPDDLGQMGGEAFRLYGGHRFWHAPEHPVRSYLPDNAPVSFERLPQGMRLTPPLEAATQLQPHPSERGLFKSERGNTTLSGIGGERLGSSGLEISHYA